MKAKKFVRKARKLLGLAGSELARFLGGDSSTMKHRGLLLNLQVLGEEYVALEKARRAKENEKFSPSPETVALLRKKGGTKVQRIGGCEVTLPKGYILYLGQNTSDCTCWTLMRRGHLVGTVESYSSEDGDQYFRENHERSDVGHDCIDSFQAAVDSLISTHEEHVAAKGKRSAHEA